MEGLGWNIYRIWSTDWFRQPILELKKLIDFITRLSNNNKTEVKTPLLPTPILETKDIDNKWIERYKQANVNLTSLSQELHLVDDSRLMNVISQYLKVESPIHVDYLKTSITQQLGIATNWQSH